MVFAIPLFVIACSKDDSPDGSAGAASDSEQTATTTTTTAVVEAPPASEIGEVQPIVIGLLEDYDRLVEQIVTDPSLAEDRNGDVAEEFLGLFEPGSDFAEDSLDTWAEWTETGMALKPVSGGVKINHSTIDGYIEPVSDDEVKFVKCTAQSYVMVEGGEETETVEGEILPGDGTAVRVDGQWYLGVLTTPAGMQGCGIGQ